MRRFILLVSALAVALAGPAAGEIGLFADPQGTSCDLRAAPQTPATWYFVFKPSSSAPELQNGTIHVTGMPAGFFTQVQPAPAILQALGDPFAGTLQFAFAACQGDGTMPVPLFTVH